MLTIHEYPTYSLESFRVELSALVGQIRTQLAGEPFHMASIKLGRADTEAVYGLIRAFMDAMAHSGYYVSHVQHGAEHALCVMHAECCPSYGRNGRTADTYADGIAVVAR